MNRADPKPPPPPRPRPAPHPVDPRRPRPGRLPVAALVLGASLILTPFYPQAWTDGSLALILLVAALPLYAAASLLFSPAVLRRLEVPASSRPGTNVPPLIRNHARGEAAGVRSPVLTPAATYSSLPAVSGGGAAGSVFPGGAA